MGPNLGPERGVSHLGALEQWPTEGMPPCPHCRLAMARLSRGGPLAFTSRCYGAWGVESRGSPAGFTFSLTVSSTP